MTSTENPRPDGDVVEVRIPADVVYVSTLRLTAASLAARCDLTIDDIEDLRLAVDEACALLLPHAKPKTPLEARFVLATGPLAHPFRFFPFPNPIPCHAVGIQRTKAFLRKN